MDYEIIHLEPMKVMGISQRTCNSDGSAMQDIPNLWGRFYEGQLGAHIPNKTSEEVLAVYTDYESDHTGPYTLLIGCKVSGAEEIPPDMTMVDIPGATYAKLHVSGSFPDSLLGTWQQVWDSDLARSYTVDLEVYGDDFSKPSKEFDICIALNTLTELGD